MADTTTTLNPGSGGDSMDESSVTQTGGTVAKRPRVVLGNDQGQLVDPTYLLVALEQIVRELRAHTTILMALLSTTANPLGPDEIYNQANELHQE